jgi:hypothetical protein
MELIVKVEEFNAREWETKISTIDEEGNALPYHQLRENFLAAVEVVTKGMDGGAAKAFIGDSLTDAYNDLIIEINQEEEGNFPSMPKKERAKRVKPEGDGNSERKRSVVASDEEKVYGYGAGTKTASFINSVIGSGEKGITMEEVKNLPWNDSKASYGNTLKKFKDDGLMVVKEKRIYWVVEGVQTGEIEVAE